MKGGGRGVRLRFRQVACHRQVRMQLRVSVLEMHERVREQRTGRGAAVP